MFSFVRSPSFGSGRCLQSSEMFYVCSMSRNASHGALQNPPSSLEELCRFVHRLNEEMPPRYNHSVRRCSVMTNYILKSQSNKVTMPYVQRLLGQGANGVNGQGVSLMAASLPSKKLLYLRCMQAIRHVRSTALRCIQRVNAPFLLVATTELWD